MKTFIIAEIGINHNGSLDIAKEMIYKSKECGVSAVKLQTYLLDERTKPGDKLYDLFKKCYLSFEEQSELFEFADSINIECFSTPFGIRSLEFLVKDIGVSRIKLASFDVTNSLFLKEVHKLRSQNKFGVILSTGMANIQEIDMALDDIAMSNITVLHCVSAYPLHPKYANLEAIKTLQRTYPGYTIGYSDHTDEILVPSLAVLAGAKVIEKHLILDKNGPGVDNPVSIDPQSMKKMVEQIETFEQILGDGSVGMSNAEKGAESFRRKS